MSHTTTLKSVVIRDVLALRQAVEALNQRGVKCELLENARPRMYFRAQEKVYPYVLKLHDGQYDVGLAKQEDGTYLPEFDEHARYVANVLGAGAACPVPSSPEGRVQHQVGMFFKEYTKAATINAAVMQGYSVETCFEDNEGNIQLALVTA